MWPDPDPDQWQPPPTERAVEVKSGGCRVVGCIALALLWVGMLAGGFVGLMSKEIEFHHQHPLVTSKVKSVLPAYPVQTRCQLLECNPVDLVFETLPHCADSRVTEICWMDFACPHTEAPCVNLCTNNCTSQFQITFQLVDDRVLRSPDHRCWEADAACFERITLAHLPGAPVQGHAVDERFLDPTLTPGVLSVAVLAVSLCLLVGAVVVGPFVLRFFCP